MTVFAYVNTIKQVGEKDHIKAFANVDARKSGSERTILKASRSSMRYWNRPRRLNDLRGAARPLVLHRERPIVAQCCILVTRAFAYER